MSEESQAARAIDRYRALGLVANPFVRPQEEQGDSTGIALEISAEAHQLLAVIDDQAAAERPKSVWVSKNDMAGYYGLTAIAETESVMATDEELNVLHAYIQLYMMRMGRIRATLNIVAERLAFRDFGKTLALYVEKILAEPDESLTAYQVAGPERLASFVARFEKDPSAAIEACFGAPEIERHPELTEVPDLRLTIMDTDVEESDEVPEIDETVGDAPSMSLLLGADEDELTEEEESEDLGPVLDYFIDHTRAHLSPVIARALRVYHDRGLAAMVTEMQVTKAPRKTLSAVIRLARLRFRKVVLILDGLDPWPGVPDDLRTMIVTSFVELRMLFAKDAFIVVMAQPGLAPEMEDAFGSAIQVAWDFPFHAELEDEPEKLNPDMIESLLRKTTLQGAEPLTMADHVLSELAERSDGSLTRFADMAEAAIESAANRSVSQLDDEALKAGLAVNAESA